MHPQFNPVAHHQYLLHTMYLIAAHKAKTFMRSNANHSAGLYGWLSQKMVNRKKGSTQFAQTSVTASPLVGCVVWSLALDMSKTFHTINIHTLIRKLLETRIPDDTAYKWWSCHSSFGKLLCKLCRNLPALAMEARFSQGHP